MQRVLVIGNLKCKNLSLLAKWGWRFIIGKGMLWREVIASKYSFKQGDWIPKLKAHDPRDEEMSIPKVCDVADHW